MQIPVQLRLADTDVSSLEQPPVLYFLVPRQSYLHSVLPRALALLQHLLPPGELSPWFEHGRLPLQWGVPAGALYDLVGAPSRELPWRLTLHFRAWPARLLPPYGGEAALRAAFFGSLKEAACVARGSAQRVMEMAAGAQEELWRHVLAASLAPYRRVLASLQLAPAAPRPGRRPAVPLRLYLRRDAGGFLSSYEDIAATSRPAEVQAADGGGVSLRQALLPLLAEWLAAGGGGGGGGAAAAAAPQSEPGTPLARAASSATEGGSGEAGAGADAEAPAAAAVGTTPAEPVQAGEPVAAPAAAAEDAAAALLDAAGAARRVLVGGVAPPLDAPLAWLHAHLHAPDYFLYVVVHAEVPPTL